MENENENNRLDQIENDTSIEDMLSEKTAQQNESSTDADDIGVHSVVDETCEIDQNMSDHTEHSKETHLPSSDASQTEMHGAESFAYDSCLQPLDIRADVLHELENQVYSVAPASLNKPHHQRKIHQCTSI
jgi:hypothetical protein